MLTTLMATVHTFKRENVKVHCNILRSNCNWFEILKGPETNLKEEQPSESN